MCLVLSVPTSSKAIILAGYQAVHPQDCLSLSVLWLLLFSLSLSLSVFLSPALTSKTRLRTNTIHINRCNLQRWTQTLGGGPGDGGERLLEEDGGREDRRALVVAGLDSDFVGGALAQPRDEQLRLGRVVLHGRPLALRTPEHSAEGQGKRGCNKTLKI